MAKFIIVTPQGPQAFGPYTDEIELLDSARRLREEFGHTGTVIIPLSEEIDWPNIEHLDSGTSRSQVTREILAELFPTVGITIPASEVREVLQNYPDAVTGGHLTNIRKEMGIVSRPHHRRGYSGVQYWEWTRERISAKEQTEEHEQISHPQQKEQTEQQTKRRPGRPKKVDVHFIQAGDPNIWVDEDRVDEYLADPENYQGEIEYTTGYRQT